MIRPPGSTDRNFTGSNHDVIETPISDHGVMRATRSGRFRNLICASSCGGYRHVLPRVAGSAQNASTPSTASSVDIPWRATRDLTKPPAVSSLGGLLPPAPVCTTAAIIIRPPSVNLYGNHTRPLRAKLPPTSSRFKIVTRP